MAAEMFTIFKSFTKKQLCVNLIGSDVLYHVLSWYLRRWAWLVRSQIFSFIHKLCKIIVLIDISIRRSLESFGLAINLLHPGVPGRRSPRSIYLWWWISLGCEVSQLSPPFWLLFWQVALFNMPNSNEFRGSCNWVFFASDVSKRNWRRPSTSEDVRGRKMRIVTESEWRRPLVLLNSELAWGTD